MSEWDQFIDPRTNKLEAWAGIYEKYNMSDMILYVEESSKGKGTYRVKSKYKACVVVSKVLPFDSIDSAKEWLIDETIKVLAMLQNDIQGLK